MTATLYVVISGNGLDSLNTEICIEGIYTNQDEAMQKFKDVENRKEMARLEQWGLNKICSHYIRKKIIA